MRKILLLFMALVLLFRGAAFALDAPHNETNQVSCFDCHLGGQSQVDPNTVCLNCHINDTGGNYSKSSAPKVATHAGTKYGAFQKQCTDCHYFHFFSQHYVWGSASYIATGTIVSYVDNGNDTVTFTYSNLNVKRANWSDPAKWGQKTGPERGLIFLPNTKDVSFGFEIISADASTITVKGSLAPFSHKIHPGDTFAIIYGQGINVYIPNFTKQVKFFDQSGTNSFAHNDMLAGDIDGDGNPDDSTPDGVCQVCHTQTGHWLATGAKAAIGVHATQNGTNCTKCHPHGRGFLPACDTCHGNPPTTANLGGPDGLANDPDVTGSTTPGAHQRHATSTGLNYPCKTCHTGYTMPESPQQIIDIGFDIFTYGGANTKYDGQSTVDGYRGNNGTTVSQTGTLTCSNIYCHSIVQSNGGGPLTPDTADYASPVWNDPATAQCGTCHKADGVQGNATLMDSGSHTKHVSTATYGFSCSKCHNGAGSGSSVHVNNVINVVFDPAIGGSYGGDSTDSGNHAPGQGYGSCTSTYCHSDGRGGAPNTVPVWGSTLPTDCTGCHNNNAAAAPNTMSSGSHTAHINKGTIMSNKTCDSCHSSTVTGDRTITGYSMHVNMSVDVTINATYDGDANPSNNYAAGQCSDLYCHSNATSLSGPYSAPNTVVTWGVTTGLGCSDCHDGPPSGPSYPNGTPKANSHATHTGAPLNYGCVTCHDQTVDSTNAIVNPANHLNKVYNVSGTKIGSYAYDPAGGTCTNISCHGGGNAQWGAALGCADCHTNDMGLNATVRRGIYKTGNDFTRTSHHIAAVPADASCEVCHNRSNHTQEGDPAVRLFNEDTGAAIVYDGTGASLEGFCVSCHDADGASRLGVNAMQPFVDSGDTNAPANIGWNSATVAHSALAEKCFGCHGNSGAAGTTLDPVINAHGSDSAKILRYTGWLPTDESGFCYNCHGSPTANGAQDDIQSVFALTSKHGDQNCAACHNKHQAEPGLHTQGSGSIAPVNYGATVLDAAAVAWPTAWTATDFSLTAKTEATAADEEWQLCLKCHNGGGPALTDIALEFNPNNASYHSVVQLNPNRNTEVAGTGVGEGGPAFVPPWTPNSRMTCSDCHTNSDNTQAQGPHGSAVAFVLVAPYDSTTGMAGTQNHLCFRCHDWEGYVNNNQDCKNDPCQYHTGFSNDQETSQNRKEFNLHAYHNREGYSCRNCHLGRPHGAQAGPKGITRALLIWDGTNTPAPYRQAGATANEWLYIETWQASPGNWNKNNCSINTAGGGH